MRPCSLDKLALIEHGPKDGLLPRPGEHNSHRWYCAKWFAVCAAASRLHDELNLL